jgi:hypothetical protein
MPDTCQFRALESSGSTREFAYLKMPPEVGSLMEPRRKNSGILETAEELAMLLTALLLFSSWTVDGAEDGVVRPVDLDPQPAFEVTVLRSSTDGISLVMELDAVPLRNKQVRVAAALQVESKRTTGAAYAVVQSPTRSHVHYTVTRARGAGSWAEVVTVANVPADADIIVIGLYAQDDAFSAARKAIFKGVRVQETQGEPVAINSAVFLYRPRRVVGSNMALPSWTRSDDSRVFTDGQPLAFLHKSVFDPGHFGAYALRDERL